MRVLVACEFSGTVRRVFEAKGCDVLSCDLLEAEDGAKNHYVGDVFDVINDGFDLMIAHPPCTYLSNSGVRHLYTDRSRWDKMIDGARFFNKLYRYDTIPRRCIENPIMHKYAKEIIGDTQTQVIQPWMFGHHEQKATCLWLVGLEPLQPLTDLREEMKTMDKRITQRLFYASGKDRWKIRSRTFEGIAKAMADTWTRGYI